MDFFHGQDYQTAYSWGDFPIETPYRERLFFEVSIATLDQSLEVMAANCCSTPTADHNKEHRFRHELIHEGYVVFRSTKFPRIFPFHLVNDGCALALQLLTVTFSLLCLLRRYESKKLTNRQTNKSRKSEKRRKHEAFLKKF